ncbi:hypothetical protein CPC08DRAFT_688902 [Agrocybe pediades]|nr:hypothetical protein CPC08DRAFT_688902 [Agrocybe pediades]
MDLFDLIYVVSLADRLSRRDDMEKLRHALRLNWQYHDALPANDDLVLRISNSVSQIRLQHGYGIPQHQAPSVFAWPDDIDKLAKSRKELDLWSSDFHELLFQEPPRLPYPPLTCARNNFDITSYSSLLREHFILTPPRIACWHSHLTAIQKIANNNSDRPGVALILEDDVDMEVDIVSQLSQLWPTLPADWDIVFVGHCWSDESLGPPLTSVEGTFSASRLFHSTRPKCTHAYALSRVGARRLLLHLRYPLFAYSRAIDQAFAWLVESGRLKGFSVVPSLIIQRKVTPSDVLIGGVGSKWKDSLRNGVFDGQPLT